jgi:uncharacterized protein YlxP (DUF503 family)
VDEPAFVVLMRVHLHFPDVASLKGKRAELAHQDTWQRSTLAVALTAGSPARCDAAADNVCRYLDARFPQGVRVERRVASWNDLESLR